MIYLVEKIINWCYGFVLVLLFCDCCWRIVFWLCSWVVFDDVVIVVVVDLCVGRWIGCYVVLLYVVFCGVDGCWCVLVGWGVVCVGWGECVVWFCVVVGVWGGWYVVVVFC